MFVSINATLSSVKLANQPGVTAPHTPGNRLGQRCTLTPVPWQQAPARLWSGTHVDLPTPT
jgi:hypothetical protein